MFPAPIRNRGFKPCKNVVSDQSWKWLVLTKRRGTDLETQLLGVRHVSRLEYFYLGLLNFVLKPAFLNMCGLPSRKSHSMHELHVGYYLV